MDITGHEEKILLTVVLNTSLVLEFSVVYHNITFIESLTQHHFISYYCHIPVSWTCYLLDLIHLNIASILVTLHYLITTKISIINIVFTVNSNILSNELNSDCLTKKNILLSCYIKQNNISSISKIITLFSELVLMNMYRCSN